ncbi:hypothetical protein OPV22_008517 [Ensete ventricosum]|uniref:Uncharacterized protein n=1 Tax=Ensete ventricosum TaxID=4639 RepID=A0AAV8PPB8_ENSVE|nr:hypothetical protein OPV22_008517 [Ensete ventricosum]
MLVAEDEAALLESFSRKRARGYSERTNSREMRISGYRDMPESPEEELGGGFHFAHPLRVEDGDLEMTEIKQAMLSADPK